MVFFKKELTVLAADVTGGPLTDFSLLVSITDSDLQKNARSDGFDIFFTESDGTTVLPYERESYDSSTGELVAWVLVDLLDTAGNKFFMFYGDPDQTTDQQDPTGLWDRFEDVFLFNDAAFPWTNSSVGKNFTIETNFGEPTLVGGQMNLASNITSGPGGGTGHLGRMPSTSDVSPTDFFVSEWIKEDVIVESTRIDNWASTAPAPASGTFIILQTRNNEREVTLILLDIPSNTNSTSFIIENLPDMEYHHVAFRYSSNSFDLFFDGDLVDTQSYTFNSSFVMNAQQIGGGDGSTPFTLSRVDQLQVALDADFSNGFIKTSFDNQKDAGQGAGNFVKVGVQQTTISNNYLLLSQGAISEESSSIINAICGDSSLKIGDTVRLLPVGTGEGFTQSDDLLPRVGIPDEVGASSYGIVVGGDFEGAYGIDPSADILSLGLIAAFFGDGVRICTQGKCLAFADGTLTFPINIGDGLTATDSGLALASGTQQVIARALQSTSLTNTIIAVDVHRECRSGIIPIGDFMLYEDIDIMEYEDFIDMDYET